ncbi:hypothetical protein ACK8HY_00480 [Sphingobacterium sp. NGMCC 1.201703]|uniref:hypothetical protein n=1 Tax=Sphingobacterium sp. NGMCC 1.201703 TaxID=3388657 RepID=UPI0039FD2C91
MKIFRLSLLTASISLILVSCNKNELQTINEEKNIKLKSMAVASTTFNWENVERMPVPINHPTILSPWSSGANIAFPAFFIEDRFKSNGWELVYNSFSTTETVNPKFFIIYNKFRGLLRAFFYLDPISPIPSTYVTHSLKLKDNASIPVLNYGSDEIASLVKNAKEISQVQPYRTSATGCWYAAEFEINYTPAIRNMPAQGSLLQWDVNSTNISQITINGTSEGTIKGTMTQSVAGPENILNSSLKGTVMLYGKHLGDSMLKEINENKLIKSEYLLNFASSLASGGYAAAAGKVLSAIFGGSSTTTSQVINLKSTTSYKLSGSVNDSYLIAAPVLVPPGASNSSNSLGILPLYNKVLGVFTLDKTPIVNATAKEEWYTERGMPGDRDERFSIYNPSDYRLVQNSYNILFNPDIINTSPDGARVENLKQELVQREKDGNLINVFPINYEFSSHYRITVGNIGWDGNGGYIPQPASPSPWDSNEQLMTGFFLRISFDVVPNNGSSRTKIVKSFKIKANPIDIKS